MKLAVIADTHLGYKFGTPRGTDAFNNAADAFKKALATQPDLILLLGDMFDNKVAKPEVLKKAMQLFKRVNEQLGSDGISESSEKDANSFKSIIAIYGTHETRHKDAVNPMHLLAQAGLLTLLHKSSVVKEKDGQKVAIHGLSGVHDSFARDELKEWSPQKVQDAFNVMLIHQTFEEDIPKAKHTITYEDLPVMDLYLAGHIHYPHEKEAGGAAVLYPGSTVRTQLGQNTPQELGFYLLEVENNKLSNKQFVTLDAPRKFFNIKIDVSNNEPGEIISKLTTQISGALSQHSAALNHSLTSTTSDQFSSKSRGAGEARKPLIKVKLVGEIKKGFRASDLQLASVRKQFKEACFLKIDKSHVTSKESKQRLKFLANLGQQQKSIEGLGIDLLCQNLKETQVGKSKVAELFQKFSDGELEAAEKVLSARTDVTVSKDVAEQSSASTSASKASQGKSKGGDGIQQEKTDWEVSDNKDTKGSSWQDTFEV